MAVMRPKVAYSEDEAPNHGKAVGEAPASAPGGDPGSGSPLPVEFREGGYGWLVVAAVSLLNFHTWGLNSTFAVFLAYYLREGTFANASPIGYAFVGGLSISVALLVSPLATALAGWKYVGTKKTIYLGTVVQAASFVGASFTSHMWHLLLTQGVAFGIGMGLIFTASVPVPAQWFNKRRSLANACAAAGSGFGGLTYSLAANAMISRIGLPWTFRTLAIICLVVNSISGYLIRDRNKDVGSVHVPLNWGLFRRPSFLLLEAWLVFSIIPYIALVFSVVDYCRAVGLTASQASLVGALFNMSQGLGRPVIGLSSDKVGRINVSTFCTGLCGLFSLFLWVFAARSLAACIVFALLSGTVAGVMWATVAPVCAEVVGLPLIPSALSMTWLVLVVPATFAEVIALVLRQPGSHGYLRVQLFIGLMYMVAFVFSWLLRAWKVHDLEKAGWEKQQADTAVGGGLRRLGADTWSSYLRGLWVMQRV